MGVAGWSYPDWRETVYRLPESTEQPSLFATALSAPTRYTADPLAYLARFVDMIEINSTFYRIPSVQSTMDWARRVNNRPGFFYTAKLNREFTHAFREEHALATTFRTALHALRDAGCLRALLLQFRYDFANSAETRRHVQWLHAQFAEFAPLVVEVRHRSWETPDALQFFRDLDLTVANLDYPTGRDSFDLDLCVTTGTGYLRLHGRNRQAWFSKASSPSEPYNYDYSDAEIEQVAGRARRIMGKVRHLTIVANNHFRGKGLSAALRLKAALTRQRLPVPPALLDTYPALARIAEEKDV